MSKMKVEEISKLFQIGHMFGVQHNREIARTGPISSLDGGYEYGNLIDGGYVSIMA